MTEQAPANWYPDPFGRHEHRYWDGAQWTHHVASRGAGSIDPPVMTAPGTNSPAPAAARGDKRVKRDVQTTGIVAGARPSGGSLLTEPVLVVNQRAKLIEVNAEYAVYNQHGQAIGSVREVGQNIVKKALRIDQYSTRKLQMIDLSGQIVLSLIVPVTLIMAKVVVLGADGIEVGRVVQKFGILNAHFALMSGKQVLGSVNGEGWESWDFNVQDADGREIARITKKWAAATTNWSSTRLDAVWSLGGRPKGLTSKSPSNSFAIA